MHDNKKLSHADRNKLSQLQKQFDTNGNDIYVLTPKDLIHF